jgi:hypothetical protein
MRRKQGRRVASTYPKLPWYAWTEPSLTATGELVEDLRSSKMLAKVSV